MSKLILFDFECPSGHRHEALVKTSKKSVKCPVCGNPAKRQISAPRIDKSGMALMEGATPTSIDHFERLHRQQKAIEEKRERDHGDYGVQPGSSGGGSYRPPRDSDFAPVVADKLIERD